MNSYGTAFRHLALALLSLPQVAACAATPGAHAVSFSGYVTESSGVNGIDGVVISVEWLIVPSGAAKSTESKPAVLAVWQARTNVEGQFQVPEERLQLPRGMEPAPKAFPRLQVFAVGKESYAASGLERGVSVDEAGHVSIKWPEDVVVIRLVNTPESPEILNTQFEVWHAELKRAIREEIWVRGEEQAIASYSPLLDLLSESCVRYQLFLGAPAPACEAARADFGSKEPPPH